MAIIRNDDDIKRRAYGLMHEGVKALIEAHLLPDDVGRVELRVHKTRVFKVLDATPKPVITEHETRTILNKVEEEHG